MLQIIKASAGSGKTYTLALEYISLLLGEKDGKGRFRLARSGGREYHRHILAVTFTNKATEEMKERIVKELAVLAGLWNDGDSPYMATLCHRFGVEDEKLIRKAAYTALYELLFDFTNFNVSTIDSFFQVILRTFAGEVDVPYDYNIELNERYAMKVGIHDFLSKIKGVKGASNQTLGWINNYVREQIDEGGNWNIFSSASNDDSDTLFKFASVINTEIFRREHVGMENFLIDNDGANIGLLQKHVADCVKESEHDIVAIATSLMSMIDCHGFSEYMKKSGPAKVIKDFAAGNIKTNDSKTLNNIFVYLDAPEDAFKKIPKNKPQPDAVIRIMAPEMGRMKQLLYDLLTYKAIYKNIYMLGLLGNISRSVFQYRKDNNLILLSDTNELLHDVINEQDAPFIYERIGVWINNFLIDEFQDTSALQWDNLKPLLSQSLSCDNDNLIIGDEKQCIYRFRNSYPSLLQYQVKEAFPQQSEIEGSKSVNWRSAPCIIKFNNAFFTEFAKFMGLGDIYANVVQQVNSKKRQVKGYVKVDLISTDKAVTDEQGEDLKFKEIVLDRLPERVCELLDRGYRQNDIAILVDTNIEGSIVIKRLLEYNRGQNVRHNLKVISSDSLLLKNSPSVRLIISHLRYIGIAADMVESDGKINNKRELNEKLHRLLRRYENGINKGQSPEESLENCFADVVGLEQAVDEMNEFIPRGNSSYSIVSIVERIIEKTISPEALDRENAFIQALQDYVIEFAGKGNPSIRSFMNWWDRVCDKLSITSPSGIDAVNVMTIHKSKGLEFPCVIIPFANWKMCKIDSTIWIPGADIVDTGVISAEKKTIVPPLVPVKYFKQIAGSKLGAAYSKLERESMSDSLNKTYVAFTRAVDELHVFAERKESKGTGPTLTLDEFLSSYEDMLGRSKTVDELNDAYGADVAIGVEGGKNGFEAGVPTLNDRADVVEEDVMPMSPYFVENRHDLVKYVMPEVYYTEQQERGILLHKILGMIHDCGEVEKVLLYCRSHCVIVPSEYEEVSSIIKEIIAQNDEVSRWFAPGNRVYNERAISAEGKKIRPDRVIITPDGRTVVIDYKFGNAHVSKYHEQVRHYMKIVSDAGLTNVSGFIWYPLEKRIEQVAF